MVLVSYKLDNYVSILQTKLSHRERHKARRIGLEAMPLDQHIEGGHGECQAGLKVLPAPVHDFLEVADHRQHREHRLHQHAVLPRTALTQFEVGGVTLRRMETGVAQDNHAPVDLANEPLEGLVCDIGGITRPPHDQAPLIQSGDSSELAARLPCKGKSVRNRGVSQTMPFLVIPRSLLRGGFIKIKQLESKSKNPVRSQ